MEEETQKQTSNKMSLWEKRTLESKDYNFVNKLPEGATKDKLLEDYYQKWHNMSKAEYDTRKKEALANEYHPLRRLKRVFQTLSIPGTAAADFPMDVIGNVPGLQKVDDTWDEKTKLDHPFHQGLREVLSVVLPSMWVGAKSTAIMQSSKLNRAQKAVQGTGLFSVGEAGVIGLSDQGEDHNIFGTMAKTFPGMFGPTGRIPLPDLITTKDSDSPSVRKWKNILETGPLSVFGSIAGGLIQIKTGKKMLSWLEPLDETAKKYKAKEILNNADEEKLVRLNKINDTLQSGQLSKADEITLIDEMEAIKEELSIVDDIDQVIRRDQKATVIEQNKAAQMKLQSSKQLELFDQDVTPGILNPASEGRQVPPPGFVARNMADTTAIKTGSSVGDPPPILTDAMRTKGLMVDDSTRAAVMGVEEATRDVGRFNALVDGIRYSGKQMNAAAWDIYTSIIAAPTLDDVKALFLDNKDTQNFLLGRFKVEKFNEEQARAAAFGLKYLTDRYLGRSVTEASARVMDTLGREVATIAEGVKILEPFADENRAMDLILDKMQYLLDEYGLNKYLSGWNLRNKNWFDQVPPNKLDEVIDELTKEFTSKEQAIALKNKRFIQELKRIKSEKPELLKPFVDAFAHTKGDVDSQAKLMKWAAEQVTPVGLLKSPDPKQLNLFAKGLWAVRYNNVLSGLSAFRAAVGNTAQLVLRPITAVLGHGIWGFTDNFDGLTRTMYTYGSMFETNKRALHDAYEMMKLAHKDPELMMKAYRKDFLFKEDAQWDILDQMREVWVKEGNHGRVIQYDLAHSFKQLAEMPTMRYGMTGMVLPDMFTNVHMAHYLSRVRAYDDVFSEFGFADWTKIHAAEKRHYQAMFDAQGLPKDQVLKQLAGEITLNLDDGLSKYINEGVTAYPILKELMMFPRTASNYVKNSLSWTPISVIPGINKYGKTIWARTDDEIAAALLEHGIDMATTPNARAIFQNLRAEYTGRVAFSSLLVGSLWSYAMAGNIRGNGHYNASRRSKERTEMGYEPKTINIAGKWVSYKGILGIEQMLSILGDMAYYKKDIDAAFLEDIGSKLMWTVAASFLNETPLQGLEPLIKATNGDLGGWERIVSNSIRSTLPLSGGAGVVANAVSSTLKDIEGRVDEHLRNRLPFFNLTLPDHIDIWTGESVNDIDNPVLRVLNALSPFKVSGTNEPWREALREIGWDGIARLRTHSSGMYEYTPEQREQINKYIGELKLYKEIDAIIKRNQKSIDILRAHRSNNVDLINKKAKLETKHLPVFAELNLMLRTAQQYAEQRMAMVDPSIIEEIQYNQLQKLQMQRGDVEGAIQTQKDAYTQKLLRIANPPPTPNQ
tara:strand:+ start:5059 stop:9084 length:4026 start_codon:yes stop_codon:yes gene_type:complete